MQGKVPAGGPGGGKGLLPECASGGGNRPLILGAESRRQGEANPSLSRLCDGEEASCALRLPLGSETSQPCQDLHGTQLLVVLPPPKV